MFPGVPDGILWKPFERSGKGPVEKSHGEFFIEFLVNHSWVLGEIQREIPKENRGWILGEIQEEFRQEPQKKFFQESLEKSLFLTCNFVWCVFKKKRTKKQFSRLNIIIRFWKRSTCSYRQVKLTDRFWDISSLICLRKLHYYFLRMHQFDLLLKGSRKGRRGEVPREVSREISWEKIRYNSERKGGT